MRLRSLLEPNPRGSPSQRSAHLRKRRQWIAAIVLFVALLVYIEFVSQAQLSHALVGVSVVTLSVLFTGRWSTFLFAAVATVVALLDIARAGGAENHLYLPDVYLGLVLVWVAATLIHYRKMSDVEREQVIQGARDRQSAVVALATDPSITFGDIGETAKQASEILADQLGVARASIWFLSENRSELRCINLFEASLGKHSSGTVLRASDYPRYFAALQTGRAIDAHDARTDPRTSEYTPGYLVPLGITSMLDAGIRVAGRNFGVVCCEHIGRAREWQPEDLAFAGEIADQIAQSVVNEENRRVHEAVKANERKYRDLVETSNDLIWAVDSAGRWTFVNRGPAESLLGYSPEEMIGRSVSDFQTKSQAKRDANLFERVKAGEHLFFHETIFIKRDGQPINLSFNAIALRDERGEVIGATGTATDISGRLEAENRRRALEEQLRNAQHMESLGRLAGGIAHDFNNLLGAILVNAELLQSGRGATNGSAEAIVKAAQRGKGLISQILTFSRQVKPTKSRTDLGALAREIEQLIRVTLPQNITFSVNISGDSVVVADSGQMSQVLMNLCTNAIYAMKDKGGELQLDVASIPLGFVGADRINKLEGLESDVVMLRVSDTGGGIAPTVKDKIFEPFFSTKPVGEGTGLGLSVVLGIVESHGGQIYLESTLGVGTVFELYFPPARAVDQSVAIAEGADAQMLPLGGTEHIILVDDEEMVLEVSAVALRQFGYKVSAFTEPERVIESIERGILEGDLLVTDLTMPRVTGTELAARIRSKNPGFPVILCSGYDLSAQSHSEQGEVVTTRLSKPYSVNELLLAVRQTLDGESAKSGQSAGNF